MIRIELCNSVANNEFQHDSLSSWYELISFSQQPLCDGYFRECKGKRLPFLISGSLGSSRGIIKVKFKF